MKLGAKITHVSNPRGFAIASYRNEQHSRCEMCMAIQERLDLRVVNAVAPRARTMSTVGVPDAMPQPA